MIKSTAAKRKGETQMALNSSEGNRIKFIDFCAGIGAGRLGLERGMNATCVGYSEISEMSIKTYNLLHDTRSENNYGDLTKINSKNLPDFDLMIAGFPCQSFSIIGQRKGFKDDRGQIINYLINILKDKKVPYFIFENVKGLANHDSGNTIRTIVETLEEAGYQTEYKVLNSVNYGVPQMRERVYFVGSIKDNSTPLRNFHWPEERVPPDVRYYLCGEDNDTVDIHDITFQKYLNNKYNKGRIIIEDILKNEYDVVDTRQSDLRVYKGRVPTLRTGRHGILYVKNGELQKLSGYESLLLQGFDKEQARKVSGVVSEQQLLSQAGNAMTVSVIQQISEQLHELIRSR